MEPRIEIARAGAHRHAGGGREAHAGFHRFSVAHRREARAIAEVGEDHPPARRFGSRHALQFAHEERIRQSVKAIPPHAERLVAARNRQHLRDPRQVMVKGRVEARHLGQIGKSALKRLGQQNLLRQMLGIEWAESAQLPRPSPP